MRKLCFVLFAVLVLFGGCGVGWSQTAQISGVVQDTAAANVSGAVVEIRNEKTGEVHLTRTNGSGLYAVPSLEPGVYTVKITAAGFGTEIVGGVVVEVAGKVTRNVDLKVGPASEEVQVDGGGQSVNTIDATVSTVVDRRFVENLPLNGRSFQSLMTLAPGVIVVPSAGSGSSGEISVNGQRTESNYYTIDGISANTGATVSTDGFPGAGFSGSTPQGSALGTTQSIVSIDALEQFRITTSSYSAEYGRTPGGQFSFSSRGGTNQWHGTAFEFLRNDALDAMNRFDTVKLPQRQNDFGGTLGGYLRIPKVYDGRNRTFFFFSYEGLCLTSPKAATLYQVPSNALRAAAPAALKPFLAAFPVSSNPDLGNGLANYTAGYSAPSRLDTNSIRIDHSFGDRFKIFGRYSDVPSESTSRQASALSQVNATVRNVKTLVLGASAVVTPAMVNEFRFGVTGNDYKSNRYLDNFGGATPVALSSAPGLSNGDWMTFFLFYGLYPYYLLEPQSNRQRQLNVTDSMTQTVGRHSLKYGVDLRRLVTSEKLPPLWEVAFFYNQQAVLNNTPAGLYVYTQNVNMKSVTKNFSLYLQDEWKATERLSVSAGVRWDVNPPPTDANGNTPYTVDQITNLATVKAAPKGTALWKTTYGNFAPRLGVAYQLYRTPGFETVLRAGGGLFYDTGQALSAQGYYGIGTTGFASYTAPFPATLQQVQAAPVPNANAPYNAPIYGYDPNLKQPYVGQWNVALEQSCGARNSLLINYVSSAGRQLVTQRFYHPEALGNTAFSSAKGLYISSNAASSDYNSLQVRFDRKLSRGLQVLAAYTWSKAMDDATSNFTVYQLRRSVSDYDIRNNFQMAASYDLPGRYASPSLAYALQHWSIDARVSSRSSLPVDVLQAATIDATSGANVAYHPNLVANQPLYVYGNQYAAGRAINFQAFSNTTVPGQDGDAGRNIARGFSATQGDVTLRRDFPFTERVGVQFRAEAYNVLNHPIYGTVRNSLSAGAGLFGQAYNTLNNQLGGLSSLYQVGGPRSLQVSLKLHF